MRPWVALIHLNAAQTGPGEDWDVGSAVRTPALSFHDTGDPDGMSKDFKGVAKDLSAEVGKLSEAIPDVLTGFRSMMKAASDVDGAITVKTKELIALAIAVTVRCDGCIASHVRAVIKAGATRAEVAEAIGVAILMGGGPSMVYGAQALEAYDQFSEA